MLDSLHRPSVILIAPKKMRRVSRKQSFRFMRWHLTLQLQFLTVLKTEEGGGYSSILSIHVSNASERARESKLLSA
jgi:hypothetical protein